VTAVQVRRLNALVLSFTLWPVGALTMSEHRRSRRLKSFLGSFAYFDKRRGVMSCLVRDFSDEGARIIFSETVTIPDVVNLHLPQKDITLKAKVT